MTVDIEIRMGTMYSSRIWGSKIVPCLMISYKAFMNAIPSFLSKLSILSANVKYNLTSGLSKYGMPKIVYKSTRFIGSNDNMFIINCLRP